MEYKKGSGVQHPHMTRAVEFEAKVRNNHPVLRDRV